MIVVVGIIVGFVVISMYMPMFKTTARQSSAVPAVFGASVLAKQYLG